MELSGISYTSILMYLNEIVDPKKILDKNPEWKSHKFSPGQAIVNYIEGEMKDETKWRNFPKVLMKAMTANTYFYTRMMEMCQYKQIRHANINLQVVSQIIYQVVKIGIQRQVKKTKIASPFPDNLGSTSVYSVMMMPQRKALMLFNLS